MKNYVKRVLVLMMVLLPCFQISVWAGGEPEQIPVKNDPPGTGPRNRARARTPRSVEMPSCYHCDDEVFIQADSSTVYITATVVRLEDDETWSSAGAGDSLTMTVSDQPGTYVLYLTLSDGRSYYGEYTLY